MIKFATSLTIFYFADKVFNSNKHVNRHHD